MLGWHKYAVFIDGFVLFSSNEKEVRIISEKSGEFHDLIKHVCTKCGKRDMNIFIGNFEGFFK
jgi:hypothetical protein